MSNTKKIVGLLALWIWMVAISPVSLAAYVYGPGASSTFTVELGTRTNYGDFTTGGDYLLETAEVVVTESGLYCVSASTNYFLCTMDEQGNFVPLPVSTYVNEDGAGGLALSNYNNAGQHMTTVYCEEGKTYYTCFMGDDGFPVAMSGNGGGLQKTLSMQYVQPADDMEIYQTQVSSRQFTATLPSEASWSGYTEETGMAGVKIAADQVYREPDLPEFAGEDVEKVNQELTNLANSTMQQDASGEKASFWEMILTTFIVRGIGDGLRIGLSYAFGTSNISIDDFLFNEYSGTQLSIFSSSYEDGVSTNSFLADSGILDRAGQPGILTKYFNFFTGIAMVLYISIMLYMGVRILLSSTGNKRERYKSMTMDWLKGVLILFLFPIVMKYAIVVNNGIVDYLKELRNGIMISTSMPSLSGISKEQAAAMKVEGYEQMTNGDVMETMRVKALETGRLAYAMLYLFLIKELLGFIYIYFKRLVSVIFLIVIFPLVTISYAVDKIGDGKSQAFNHWLNEFLMNVFIQSFQALSYLITMSVIYALAKSGSMVNVILMIIALDFISSGDQLLRGMFRRMAGGGAGTLPKTLSEAIKTAATVNIVSGFAKRVGNVTKRFGNVATMASNVRTSYHHLQDVTIARNEQAAMEWNQSPVNPENMGINDFQGNLQLALTGSVEEKGNAYMRIAIALKDPVQRQAFVQHLNQLSEEDRQTVLDQVKAYYAIITPADELTEIELIQNASIIVEMLKGGSRGKYGAMYDWMKGQTVRDANGNEVLLEDELKKFVKGRTLSEDEKKKLLVLQSFSGSEGTYTVENEEKIEINLKTGKVEDDNRSLADIFWGRHPEEEVGSEGRRSIRVSDIGGSGAMSSAQGRAIRDTRREGTTSVESGTFSEDGKKQVVVHPSFSGSSGTHLIEHQEKVETNPKAGKVEDDDRSLADIFWGRHPEEEGGSENRRSIRVSGRGGSSAMSSAQGRAIRDTRRESLTQEDRMNLTPKINARLMTHSASSNENARAAVTRIVTLQQYQSRIQHGEQDAMHIDEEMDLVTDLNSIYTTAKEKGDQKTSQIIEKEMKFNLGVSLQELTAQASVDVLKNHDTMDVSDVEKQRYIDRAIDNLKNIRDHSDTSQDDLATYIARSSGLLDKLESGELKKGKIPVFVDPPEIDRDKRLAYESALRREEIRRATNSGDTVGQARVKLAKDLLNLGGSVASAGASALNVAAGAASSAFYVGATGDVKLNSALVASDVGMDVESALESIVPGTQAANRGRNSVGSAIDRGITNVGDRLYQKTDAQRKDEFETRVAQAESAKERIKRYTNRLSK